MSFMFELLLSLLIALAVSFTIRAIFPYISGLNKPPLLAAIAMPGIALYIATPNIISGNLRFGYYLPYVWLLIILHIFYIIPLVAWTLGDKDKIKKALQRCIFDVSVFVISVFCIDTLIHALRFEMPLLL